MKQSKQNKRSPVSEESTQNRAPKIPPTLSPWSILIALTSVILCFPSARNALTWHWQKFWLALTSSFQGLWDNFLHIVGEDPFTLWVNGTTILNLVVYWLFGGIYTILNVTNKPAALRRYKMQPGTNEPVDYKKLSRVLVWVLFNQIVVGYVTAWILYKAMSWRGYPEPHHLPSLLQFLSETFFHVLVEEVTFYYSHRLLHTRYLYKFIHKRHHEWTSPIAVTAIYCHPIEHFISNLLPPCLGVFIMGSHILTTWTWFILALFTTLNAHCGYHIPLFPSPEAHDYHHLKFNNCFGVIGVLDRLHKTDANFRASHVYKRHVMLKFDLLNDQINLKS